MNPGGLIIVLCDSPQGGAGRAAWWLFEGLRAAGARAEFWHFQGEAPSGENVCRLEAPGKRPLSERVAKNFSRESARCRRWRRHTDSLLAAVADARPSLINVHNLHASGLDHRSLMELPAGLPIVWTMHDLWAISPLVYRWSDESTGVAIEVFGDEAEGENAAEKRVRFYSARRPLALTAPSHWLCREARTAAPADVRVEHIPYGLPPGQFAPLEKSAARRALGLDERVNWIGFCGSATDRRKGADLFAAALMQTGPAPGWGLLTWGTAAPDAWPASWTARHFGPVSDSKKINALYSACALLACPSRADNLPLVVLEAQSCGTPVLASDAGGTADSVLPGRTGWVAPAGDAGALAARLSEAVGADLAAFSRASAEQGATYTREKMAAAHRDVFARLL